AARRLPTRKREVQRANNFGCCRQTRNSRPRRGLLRPIADGAPGRQLREPARVVSGYVPNYSADRDLVACWRERDDLLGQNASLRKRVKELEAELAACRREADEEKPSMGSAIDLA